MVSNQNEAITKMESGGLSYNSVHSPKSSVFTLDLMTVHVLSIIRQLQKLLLFLALLLLPELAFPEYIALLLVLLSLRGIFLEVVFPLQSSALEIPHLTLLLELHHLFLLCNWRFYGSSMVVSMINTKVPSSGNASPPLVVR